MRSGLIVIGVLAVVLASCVTITTPRRQTTFLTHRNYGNWAWSLRIALIWADLVLPIPQTVVIAALASATGPCSADCWAASA